MFRIGQKVTCVDDAPGAGYREWYPGTKLTLGAIYTVRHVGETITRGELGLRLAEIELTIPGYDLRDLYYMASRFRPIVEKKTDADMAILKEILERETINDRAPART